MEHIQNRMASTPKPHTFDQRSWKAIKDFVGIYNIDMDYTKIGKLTKKKLSNAYFKHGKLSRRPFETEFQYGVRVTVARALQQMGAAPAPRHGR